MLLYQPRIKFLLFLLFLRDLKICVDLGGRRIIKKKKSNTAYHYKRNAVSLIAIRRFSLMALTHHHSCSQTDLYSLERIWFELSMVSSLSGITGIDSASICVIRSSTTIVFGLIYFFMTISLSPRPLRERGNQGSEDLFLLVITHVLCS